VIGSWLSPAFARGIRDALRRGKPADRDRAAYVVIFFTNTPVAPFGSRVVGSQAQPLMPIRRLLTAGFACLLLPGILAQTTSAQTPLLELRKGDTVVFIGNTFAERLQHFNHFETLLMARFAGLQLKVRNLGWSGDTLTLQPRPLNFGDTAKHLQEQRADVILAFFGFSESFGGEAGLPQFEQDLETYLKTHANAKYNGRSAPRLALVSPIAQERLSHLKHVDVDGRNRDLERYTEAMRRVAGRNNVPFVDLFTPTKRIMTDASSSPLTINGVHVNETGDKVVAGLLIEALGFVSSSTPMATGLKLKQIEALREEIREKNQQFFYRWRPVNAEYVVGRRVEPFGSVSFPPEMRQLDEIVTDLDNRIWKRALAIGAVRYPPPARKLVPPEKKISAPGRKR
jgi:lysophospholipase L1-like esterase